MTGKLTAWLRPQGECSTIRWKRIVIAVSLLMILFGALSSWRTLEHKELSKDELQHTHIAWNMYNSKILYLDFFDNHGPLYSLLTSSVLKKLDQPRSFNTFLVLRRLSLGILFLLSIALGWLAYLVSEKITVAILSLAIFLSLYIVTVFTSEIRPDGLQNLFWLLSLVAICSHLNNPRVIKIVAAGALSGLMLMTNPKALVCLAAIAIYLLVFSMMGSKKTSFKSLALPFGVGVFVGVLPAFVYLWQQGIVGEYFTYNYLFNFMLVFHPEKLRDISGIFALYFSGDQIMIWPIIFSGIFVVWFTKSIKKQKIYFLAIVTIVPTLSMASSLWGQLYLMFIGQWAIVGAIAIDYIFCSESFRDRMPQRSILIVRFLAILCLVLFCRSSYLKSYKDIDPWFSFQKQLSEKIISKFDSVVAFDHIMDSCPGYVFNEDTHFLFFKNKSFIDIYEKINNIPEFEAEYIKQLEARKVNYVWGMKQSIYRLPELLTNYIERYYIYLPCRWERKTKLQ